MKANSMEKTLPAHKLKERLQYQINTCTDIWYPNKTLCVKHYKDNTCG